MLSLRLQAVEGHMLEVLANVLEGQGISAFLVVADGLYCKPKNSDAVDVDVDAAIKKAEDALAVDGFHVKFEKTVVGGF